MPCVTSAMASRLSAPKTSVMTSTQLRPRPASRSSRRLRLASAKWTAAYSLSAVLSGAKLRRRRSALVRARDGVSSAATRRSRLRSSR